MKNKKIPPQLAKALYALITQYPNQAFFQANHPYPITINGKIELCKLNKSIRGIKSNRDEKHYRVCSPMKSGKQAKALYSPFGFKIKRGEIHLLGATREQYEKFLKIFILDDNPRHENAIKNELTGLQLINAKIKPLTLIKTNERNEAGTYLKEGILTLDYIQGENGLRENFSTLPLSDVISKFLDICLMLKKLHDENRVHADIKPDNLMFNGKGHLVDFGYSHIPQFQYLPGNLCYVPPDIFKKKMWSKAGDVFSLGLVFIDMLSGGQATRERVNKINKDKIEYIKQICSIKIDISILDILKQSAPDFCTLLEKMIDQAPSNRPAIDECIEQLTTAYLKNNIKEVLTRLKHITQTSKRCCRLFSFSEDVTSCLDKLIDINNLETLPYTSCISLAKTCFSLIWSEFENIPGIANKKTPRKAKQLIEILESIAEELAKNGVIHAKINQEALVDIVSRIKTNLNSSPSSPCHRR